MSIQLVSRARQAGLVITPRDVFQHQTVAALAAVAGAAAADGRAGVRHRGSVSCRRRRSCAGCRARRPDRPLQPVDAAAACRRRCDAGDLTAALQARARPPRRAAAAARRCGDERAAAGEFCLDGSLPALGTVARDGLPAAARSTSPGSTRRRLRGRHRPSRRARRPAACVRGGRDGAGGLVRRRAADGRAGCCWCSTTWWSTACPGGSCCPTWPRPRRPSRGRDAGAAAGRHLVPALGAARWPTQAHDAGRLASCRSGADGRGAPAAVAGRRRARPARATPSARAGHLTLTLPPAVTAPLLTTVPAAFHAGVNDVLLTALALAVADWCRRRARRRAASVLVDLEGHGREEIVRAGARPVPHGRLVHQPVPGPARSGALDLDERWRAAAPSARRSSGSRSSCARCPTTGSATGCCATSTRRPRRRLRGAAGAADRLQLPGPVRGAPAAADWAAARRGGCGWRRRPTGACRWRTRWRSTR